MILNRSIKQFYRDNKEQKYNKKYIIRIREAKNNDLGKWETIQKSGTTTAMQYHSIVCVSSHGKFTSLCILRLRVRRRRHLMSFDLQ